MNSTVKIGKIKVNNDKPLVLFGGMNALETRDLAMQVCEHFVEVTEQLGMQFVFKACYNKADRSSIHSFHGIGAEKGARIYEELKEQFGVAIVTDVRQPEEIPIIQDYVDVMQLPAFQARLTFLVEALAKTNKPILVKKPHWSSPDEMIHVLEKFDHFGNKNVMLCERGTTFGYQNMVVDMLGVDKMKDFDVPVVFDASHSLQQLGTLKHSTGGRSNQAFPIARSAVALGIAGLFVETHPNPSIAKCDGPCALELRRLKEYLMQVRDIDDLVKDFNCLR